MSFQENPLLSLSSAKNLPSTVKELRKTAREQGIEGASKMSKLELAQRLGMAGDQTIRPTRTALKLAKPPRESRSMLIKRVMKKKKEECDKYKNVSKMTMKQLRELV